MSRANPSKSRAEKSASKVTAAVVTPVTHDIVPGKFTDHDWTFMLDRDDADDFIAEMLEEWYAKVDNIIYNKYIERQLVPYTVTQAKDAILQIIEWQFLWRDNGEPVEDDVGGWIPDTEPDAAVTDCWAQGSVPKTVSGSLPPFVPTLSSLGDGDVVETSENVHLDPNDDNEVGDFSTAEVSQTAADTSLNYDDTCAAVTEPGAAFESSLDDSRNGTADVETQPLPRPPSAASDRNGRVRRQRRVVKAATTICSALPDSYTVEQDQNQTASAAETGAVSKPAKPVPATDYITKKISPNQLPNNVVNTVYCLIDPQVQEADERRKALRSGRRPYVSSKKPAKSDSQATSNAIPNDGALTEHFVSIPSTFHPMLIDTMDLAAGVMIRDDNNRFKQGPKQRTIAESELLCKALRQGLQPVKLQRYQQTLSANDVLDTHVPIIRPLAETPPIPPINQMAST